MRAVVLTNVPVRGDVTDRHLVITQQQQLSSISAGKCLYIVNADEQHSAVLVCHPGTSGERHRIFCHIERTGSSQTTSPVPRPRLSRIVTA